MFLQVKLLRSMSAIIKSSLLIVDDNSENLGALANLLKLKGYNPRGALSGEKALNSVSLSLPDLILLDIKMPEMDGYEVCRRLKASDRTRDIPVIFISALDDVFDKVKAFEIGGVDYITKPFQAAEVLARVNTQLQLLRQKLQLQEEIRKKQQTQEALEIFVRAVGHDMRNPISGMNYLVKACLEEARASGKTCLDLPTLESFSDGCDRLLNLVNSLVNSQRRSLALGESLSFEPISIYQLCQNLLYWKQRYERRDSYLGFEIPEHFPEVMADSQQLSRVFDNLLDNALKYNPPGVKVVVAVDENVGEKGFVGIAVTDNGVGMPNPQDLFELGRRGDAVGVEGSGFGLYICQQIVRAHGGTIGVQSSPGQGSKFLLTLRTRASSNRRSPW